MSDLKVKVAKVTLAAPQPANIVLLNRKISVYTCITGLLGIRCGFSVMICAGITAVKPGQKSSIEHCCNNNYKQQKKMTSDSCYTLQ